MSVSQVKKQFNLFEAFLNKDTEGIRRLKLLKDAVNVLRTSLAAADTRAAESDAVKLRYREREAVSGNAIAELKLENDQLRQEATSRAAYIQKLEGSLTLPEKVDCVKPATEQGVRDVVKELRRQMKYMPAPQSRHSLNGKPCQVYNKEDLVSGWSHNDLWRLGAAVALASFITGQICITSMDRCKSLGVKDPDNNNLMRHLTQWYVTRNVDMRPDASTVLYESSGLS